ncbi:MAG TPA: response regulator [Anaerolineae bacterium]|nr:response regulator [Anaerolineae bacterium]
MREAIRILIVEDRATDAELAQREINRAIKSCLFQRVETREDYLAELDMFQPDVIISDYSMPHFDGLTALQLALERVPLTPVIILTGAINEDTAVECMKAGATDYVIKEHLKRLGQAVIHALEEKKLRQARRQAEEALRQSEERYRTLVYTLPDALIVSDPAVKVTYASASTLQLFGHESEVEVIGRHVLDWVHLNDQEKVKKAIETVLSGGVIRNQEYLLLKKDGSSFFGEVSASSFKDGQGQITGIIIIRDVTERKLAEEARAILEERLNHAQKMESIGQLAGGVAHDFNNLVTIIRGYSDLIQAGMATNDPLYGKLEQIRQAGERAATLTRQLLAFSRKQILAPTALDLNSLVINVHKMLERLIGEDVTLATTLQPGLWPVHADPGQIEQVIMNLVINARDAMPTGGRLTLKTQNVHLTDDHAPSRLETLTGPCVMLAVADTGCGMNESIQARIFEPFFTTKEPGKGTGLGLATVYGIVKQSGGDITVYSVPEQGTIFKIYLPAGEAVSNGQAAPQAQVTLQGGSETILLVEDEDMVRGLVRVVLQDNGYTILEARNGAAALILADQHPGQIDLLMTDVVMPQMSGPQLAEQLSLLRPHLKVLFMSGYTDDAVVRHGLLTAEVEFLAKPFSPHKLAAKVREVLDK